MTPFIHLEAVAAPLPLANVDTDKILAARFLKTIKREGLGDALFSTLRENAAFVLNRHPWSRAGILIALDNFGCGSSREHAPWALLDFGIRCIIAPSIADIFYNNCFKNGILPIILPQDQIGRLMEAASHADTAQMVVDLPSQTVVAAGEHYGFDINPARKQDLLGGIDEIARSMGFDNAICTFEADHARSQPWIMQIDPGRLST